MIYELFGMPGVGKTTISNKISQKYRYINIMKKYRETILGKLYFHLFIKFFKMDKELRNIYNQGIILCGKYIENINIMDKKIKLELYIKYMIFVYYLEKKYHLKEKNIIIEEGIIHYAIAMFAEFDIPFNVLDKLVKLFDLNKFPIGITCKMKTILEQIKKRNRKSTPIDFLDIKNLEYLLKRYELGVKYYGNKYELMNTMEVLKKIEKDEER